MGEQDASRIADITLDEHTVVRRSPDIEHERAVAIFDLLEENHFAPVSGCNGPYHLHLAIEENRLSIEIRSMANGLRKGDGGTHLITFHPPGGAGSSKWLQDEDWLDFNLRQNGHGTEFTGRYDQTYADYQRNPPKPVIDGEPIYGTWDARKIQALLQRPRNAKIKAHSGAEIKDGEKAQWKRIVSRETFDAPMTRPSASRTGETVSEISRRRPSFATRTVSKWSIRSPRTSRARIVRSSSTRSGGMISVIDRPIASSVV